MQFLVQRECLSAARVTKYRNLACDSKDFTYQAPAMFWGHMLHHIRSDHGVERAVRKRQLSSRTNYRPHWPSRRDCKTDVAADERMGPKLSNSHRSRTDIEHARLSSRLLAHFPQDWKIPGRTIKQAEQFSGKNEQQELVPQSCSIHTDPGSGSGIMQSRTEPRITHRRK